MARGGQTISAIAGTVTWLTDSIQSPTLSQRQIMARCEVCNKSGQSGNNVSHSKRHTRRRWHANVQRATVPINGQLRKVDICTRCLRTQCKTTFKA